MRRGDSHSPTASSESTIKIVYEFSIERALGLLSRLILILVFIGQMITFTYASKSGVNPGIIASCFSMNIPFTSLIFYFIYGNKITCRDFAGSIFIIAGVFLIAVGGSDKKENK